MKLVALFCAVSAASITTALAQSNVYSLNVVGYYNISVGANAKVLLGNQLNTTNNTLAGIIPNPPPSSQFFKYNGGFTAYSFDDVDLVWLPNGNASLAPGEAGFFRSPINTTLTFVGEVLQGRLTNTIVPNVKAFICSMVPQAGRVTTDLGLPADPFNQVFTWDNINGGYSAYSFDDVDLAWLPNEPVVAVGQGFVYIGQRSWIRNFTVQ
jgi:hypothetical protein